MSNFDTRTKEEKDNEKVALKIERGLYMLNSSYIPVEHCTQIIGTNVYTITPEEGGYFFADNDLVMIHCFKFDDQGNRICVSSKNVRYIDSIKYKTK